MKNSIKIAFRNTLRNKRRTILSVLTIAMGAIASLLFGGFISSFYYNVQTQIARQSGHIHIHKTNFFKYGVGKTGQFGINNYKNIISTINNSDFSNKINIITPMVSLSGIASNSYKNSSQTFIGMGMNASNQEKMQLWDGFNLGNIEVDNTINAIKNNNALIGEGLAINLDLCEMLKIEGCLDSKSTLGEIDEDINSFYKKKQKTNQAIIDILVAPASGAPNVVSVHIQNIWKQGNKNIDDRFIALPLQTAQILLYGSETKMVNTIVIQLKKAQDSKIIEQKLEELFKLNNLNLEVIPLSKFNEQFGKILAMFGFIFGFISIIITVIVLFTVSNTMSMSVVERYKEIGTLRAMGLRRWGIRNYFIIEGTIIGFIGASVGLFFAYAISLIINNSNIMWTSPSSRDPSVFILYLTQNPMLLVGVWFLLLFTTILSSVFPANKASKLPIVDALRHN